MELAVDDSVVAEQTYVALYTSVTEEGVALSCYFGGGAQLSILLLLLL